ncbi:phosphotransferase family protein [soil metagenome]
MVEHLAGLDLDKLSTWLDAHSPGLVGGALEARLIAGGKSNLTYAVTDGHRNLVVRRPPMGHVLATAHDMAREFRAMTALAPTSVSVPTTYALCEDLTVLGAPFYVMDLVPGTAYNSAKQLGKLGPERVGDLCDKVVSTLARLHAIDPHEVGLDDFGRPDGFVERQVRRWKKQLEQSRSREIPGIDELGAYLETHIPKHSNTSIVHGDYRMDNLLFDDSDTMTAVLDWEMSTLGDPLTDVALMLVYHHMAHKVGAANVTDAPLAAGYWTPQQTLDAYGAASGLDLDHMGFYLGLAYFKLAVILEGIYLRHQQGKTFGEGFAAVGDRVLPLVAEGLAATRE